MSTADLAARIEALDLAFVLRKIGNPVDPKQLEKEVREFIAEMSDEEAVEWRQRTIREFRDSGRRTSLSVRD